MTRPSCAFRLDYVWRTDRGRVREHNEDAVLCDPAWGLIVVADGVGGANAGEVASRLATEIIAERFRRQTVPRADAEQARLFVEAAVSEANAAILRQGRENPEYARMGTTVVVGSLGWDWLVLAHVGDSRIYRLRADRLEQLTRDHSFIQEVVDQGFFDTREDARNYGIGANILTRALGSSPVVEVSSQLVELSPGDLYLYCTDGLTGMIPDDWMQQILMSVGDNPLDAAADALIRIANERGGTDNITLALLRIGETLEQDASPPLPDD